MKRILNVAEKPSMARQITGCLSDTHNFISSPNKYCKNYKFNAKLDGILQEMVMTSVLGHVYEKDFGKEYSNWHKTEFDELFHANIIETVGKV